jgi:molybdopterin/thiamine biosynthesis adenylyltransferase
MPLSAEERERYSRQLTLPEIGEEGQKRLRAGRVLIVGAGGLGSPAAFYLVAAGVGNIGIMDGDVVEISNLQRQILHATDDIGRHKVDSAIRTLRALNPHVRLLGHKERLSPLNAEQVLSDYDFVVDATDNFSSKFLIADACHGSRKPYSHAGIFRFLGQTMTVLPGKTACYRCVFDSEPDAQAPAGNPPQGPLGAVPGVIGAIQATEAIKSILGVGQPLTNTLLVYEALEMTFRRIPVKRNINCILCGANGITKQ